MRLTVFDQLKAHNRDLDRLAADRKRVAQKRRHCVQSLLDAGYSLQRIADEVGLSKSAIAKIAK